MALVLAMAGLTVLTGSPASAATVGFKGPFYGQAAGTTGGSVPGSPTAQKPQSKLWFAHGSWWGALWNDTATNTGEGFTIQRYDWAGNQWIDTGVRMEARARSDLDLLWDGSSDHLYVASNSDAATVSPQAVTISRYAYAGGAWTKEWTTQVSDQYVYSPVIDKDSTGMLWMTYTQGTSVMVSHSVPGDEQTWVAPYVLPTPNGESTVSFDPATDPNQSSSDIASIVGFDGNKIGVLWSNQRTDTVYWASHADGAADRQWTTGVAFTMPEGADDHINLKSVVGTDAGRVYAVTKTSLNGAEPIFEVLVLRLDGTWDHYPYASASTNLTRPIIMLDTGNRQLYVFAAAGETVNSGGVIYYKKTSMTSPNFGSMSDRGTPFIADDTLTDADPTNTNRINNPSSTKQNVNSTTGLLVVANNDPTDYYYYNRMDLPDVTAPDTTIGQHPDASTASTDATFSFTSNEANSTFECRLDPAATTPFTACASPKTYTGLPQGSHRFEVRAKDASGKVDASAATFSWTVTPPPDTTAPQTTIGQHPDASTASTDATFSFTSNEANSTFECRLDPAATTPFTACASPKTYTGLTQGSHSFEVRARDASGNVGAPASFGWTVDTTAPQTTITGHPDASTTLTGATFSFEADEQGSTFECALDGPTYAPCTSPKAYSGLATTGHTFTVRATDGVGNVGAPASFTWTIAAPPAPGGGGTGGGGGGGGGTGGGGGGTGGGTTALDTTITGQPAASTTDTTASFSFTASQAGSSFECRLDGAAYAGCTSPKAYAGLQEGQHVFAVRAKDAAGNVDTTAATYSWSVVGTSPQPHTATLLFSDGFSSGGFAAGAWRLGSGQGRVLVSAGAVSTGDLGALVRTRATARSHATLTKMLSSGRRTLRVDWKALVHRDGAAGQRAQLVRVRDTSGRVVLTLYRVAGTGRLRVEDLHGAVTGAGRLRLDRVTGLSLVMEQRSGADRWSLRLGSRTVADGTGALGGRSLRGVTFGNGAGAGRLDYRIDDVGVWAP